MVQALKLVVQWALQSVLRYMLRSLLFISAG